MKKLLLTLIFALGILLSYGQYNLQIPNNKKDSTATYVTIQYDTITITGTNPCRIKLKNLQTNTKELDTLTNLPFQIPIQTKPEGKYLLLIDINEVQHFYTILIKH